MDSGFYQWYKQEVGVGFPRMDFNKLIPELGHFIFVFIHPYMDGNGRIGRFILNLMLASGGYPWTVIRMSERTRYMGSLEEAYVRQNIVPFTQFVVAELKFWNKEVKKILRE